MIIPNKPNAKELICILAPLAIAIVSLAAEFACLRSFDWFARSGSLLVIGGVILQFENEKWKIAETRDAIDMADGSGWGTYEVDKRRYLDFISYFYMIVGTVIWGYGDIVVHQFK